MRTALKTIGITRFCAFVIFVLAALCDTAMAQSVTLTVSPTTLTFTNVAANTISSSQTVSVSANVTTSATVQISSGSPWLDVSPLALPTVGTSGQNLTVRVKAQGLTQGTYQGFFTIAIAGSSANQVTVNVSATVVGNSVFSASPSSLAFSAQQGATTSVPATTNVRISSTGPALNYTIGGTTQSGGNWLTLSATAGAVGDSGFNVSANPTGLAPGLYLGSITIQSATTADSLTITVSLTVVGNVSVSVTPAQPAPFLFQTGVTATNSPALTQTLSVSATGGSTTFTVALSPPVTWLVLSPLNGTVGSLPATLTLTATPQGLAPGTYTTSVVVTPQNGTALTPVPISLIVSNNSLIQLATGTVTFVAGFGSASPTDQTVALTSFGSGSAIPFTAGSDSSWLTVSPTAGTVPAILTLHINQAGLNTGTYTGRITVRPTNGDTYSETILVNLTVSNTASISVTPPIVYFSYQPSQGQPSAQTFQVVAPGGAAVPITVSTLTTTCGSNWITASSSSGATPASVSVSITTTGMNPGICSGSVLIRYDSGLGLTNATVPVTVAVSNNSELAISLPAGFGVESVAQGSPSFQRIIPLTSTDPATTVTFSANAISAAGWLFQSSNSAQTPQNLLVTFQPTTLAVGSYSGTLNITSPSLPSAGQTISIPITLNITPSITVAASPTALSFSQTQGASLPAAQNLTLTSTPAGAGPTYTATIGQQTGGDWLQLGSTTGSANGGTIAVSIKQNSLAPGTYTANISLAIQNALTSTITVPVSYTVVAAQTISVSATSLTFNYQVGQAVPAPQTFRVTASTGSATFTVGTTSSTGWLVSDTANGATPKDVSISINPTGLSAGQYSGTITVASNSITSGPLTIPVTLNIAAAVVPAPTTVTNNASNVTGVIAPGEILTIKGTNLGPTTGATYTVGAGGTLATSLSGVRVLFDNIPGIPLFVRADQINVIAPWEIAGRLQVNLVVELQGIQSTAAVLRVEDSAPGIYTLGSTGIGQAAVVNQSGTINGTGANNTTPAAQGSTVLVYITGGGVTSPAGTTNLVSPLTTLQRLSGTVSVTVNGQPATVVFAGASPGQVGGLVQLNVTLPRGVTGSALPIAVTVNGRTSPSGPTIAIQ